jgi:hypothetical protein
VDQRTLGSVFGVWGVGLVAFLTIVPKTTLSLHLSTTFEVLSLREFFPLNMGLGPRASNFSGAK